MSSQLRAIRGGIGLMNDSREVISRASKELIQAIVDENGLEYADLECLWFTVTPDLKSDIPPLALLEQMGINIPALCAVEADWEGQPEKTIRVLALARFDGEAAVQHVFRGGAGPERPNVAGQTPNIEQSPLDESLNTASIGYVGSNLNIAKAHRSTALSPKLEQQLTRILGESSESLIFPELIEPNVSGFAPRRILAILRPHSVEQVAEIIRAFQSGAEPPLYAVSTGCNWGLGSRGAVEDDSVRLELDGLNQIRDISVANGWAVIEPGVTQHDLTTRLLGSRRILNVTASSAHTSILGNALDRGVGLRRQRLHDLVGVEVIMPDGELVRLGWWPHESGSAPNAAGLGPSLLSLFSQSDLGIVTAGVIRLIARPEVQHVLRLSFGADRLVLVVDAIRRWQAQGLFQGVLKIYDATSSTSYGSKDEDGYRAHLSVGGTAASVSALLGILTDEASETGLFSSIDRSDQKPPTEDDTVARVVEAGFAGDTSLHEQMLRAATGSEATMVDTHGGGWIFFLPLIPYTGADVQSALCLLDEVHEQTGVRAGATINALDSDVIDLVVSLRFDRSNEEEAAKAHRALDRLYESFTESGYWPYRLDTEHSAWADRLGNPAARALGRRLKAMLDPDQVIAHGRYS
ncbi:chorismate mutase [Cryobacterium sp. N21]|uniref:chorismate mutase n=1 Tax=Cryobacterium sp. N21 TaxID=2048289 RepID=UPI000CE4AE60|nr:chorismate mutase [Cryobacterium sp. N21]